MNLQNYYYYFQSALTPRFCDELIKYGTSQQEQLALTGGQTEKINKGKDLKDTIMEKSCFSSHQPPMPSSPQR